MARATLPAWAERLLVLVVAPLLVVALSVGVALVARELGSGAPTGAAVSIAQTGRLPHTSTVPADASFAALARPILTGRDCAVLKCVAITFDDGPGAQTATVLDALARYDALATWFPVGEVVVDSPARLRAVEAVTGTRPSLMRPPFGAISPRVTHELGRLGAPVILWDVDPLDWKYRDASTVAAVPRILTALAERGYVFVTVSELFGGHLKAGKVYTERP